MKLAYFIAALLSASAAFPQSHVDSLREVVDECISWISVEGDYNFSKSWFELENRRSSDADGAYMSYLGIDYPFSLSGIYDEGSDLDPFCKIEPNNTFNNQLAESERDRILLRMPREAREVLQRYFSLIEKSHAPDQDNERKALEELVRFFLSDTRFIEVANTASDTRSFSEFIICEEPAIGVYIMPQYYAAPRRGWVLSVYSILVDENGLDNIREYCPVS